MECTCFHLSSSSTTANSTESEELRFTVRKRKRDMNGCGLNSEKENVVESGECLCMCEELMKEVTDLDLSRNKLVKVLPGINRFVIRPFLGGCSAYMLFQFFVQLSRSNVYSADL